MALAMSMLAVGSPAFADNVGVTVNSQFIPFNSGDTQLLKITVTNGGAPSITVSVSGLSNFTAGNPQGCNTGGGSSCTINFGPGDKSKDISFSLTATGNIDSGQSKTDHGKVSARQDVLLGGNATAAFDVTLKGPQPTQALSVPQVSGVVRDMATGSPIKNAVVVLVDSGACASGKDPCQVGTDGNGAFTFASTPDKPITPGTIQIGVTRSGYDNGSAAVAARAGQSVNVSLKLKPTAAASSSASPETLPSAEGQQSTADAVTPTVAAAAPKPAGNSAPNTFSLIIIVLAGLLVLLGVGVFVMMFLNRRKGNADGNPPFSPGDAAMGAGSGVYGGAADGADPTMVANPAMTSAMTSRTARVACTTTSTTRNLAMSTARAPAMAAFRPDTAPTRATAPAPGRPATTRRPGTGTVALTAVTPAVGLTGSSRATTRPPTASSRSGTTRGPGPTRATRRTGTVAATTHTSNSSRLRHRPVGARRRPATVATASGWTGSATEHCLALVSICGNLASLNCGVFQDRSACQRLRVRGPAGPESRPLRMSWGFVGRYLVGLVKQVRLRGLRILDDQSAENRSPVNSGGVEVNDTRRRIRWPLVQ
jgi:hypothetical protein